MQTPSLEQQLRETQDWLYLRSLLAELVLGLQQIWPSGQVPRQLEVEQLRGRARQLGRLLHEALRRLEASGMCPPWLAVQAAALGVDHSREYCDDSSSSV